MEYDLYVATLLGVIVILDRACVNCLIVIDGHEILAHLQVIHMKDYVVILQKDFLFAAHAVVNCYAKRMVFKILGEGEFIFYGSGYASPPSVIFTLQAWKLILGRCSGFLAIVFQAQLESLVLEDIPMVREFLDIFLEDLPGLPLDKEVESPLI